MAGGAFAPTSGGKEYPGKFTGRVLLTCIFAATGGLIYGYDLGISAALVSSIFASMATRKYGRRPTMMTSGLLFAAGAIVNGLAMNVPMLIIGRLLLGFGIGCTNQWIEGEMAWRLSLGGAIVPGLITYVGSCLLPDTPNSKIERGNYDRAKEQLLKLRKVDNVDEEFNDLVEASEKAKLVQHAWLNIFKRKYRPQLFFAFCIPMFQQLTGMNVIVFYAPILFKTIGFGSNASLFSSLITGVISNGYAYTVVVFICVYVAAFAWSWGPLGPDNGTVIGHKRTPGKVSNTWLELKF
ncbi:hypothetical protein D5086_006936 [Populus alba]|uniref:Uncharacterized protein n=1 Tax=Populus alba TaxID=43335 RepID=A0ACC4CLX7_POPAL